MECVQRWVVMLAMVSLPGAAWAETEPDTAGSRTRAGISGTPERALALSLTSTFAPIAVGSWLCAGSERETQIGAALIGTGLIVGPSVGYFYAGATRRASLDVLTHLALSGAIVGGFVVAYEHDSSIMGGIVLISSFALVAHVVQDQIEVWRLYREAPRVSLTPVVLPDGSMGGRLDVRF